MITTAGDSIPWNRGGLVNEETLSSKTYSSVVLKKTTIEYVEAT